MVVVIEVFALDGVDGVGDDVGDGGGYGGGDVGSGGCGECEGDCDKSDHCAGSLKCSQSDNFNIPDTPSGGAWKEVPGCRRYTGTFDVCYNPSSKRGCDTPPS